MRSFLAEHFQQGNGAMLFLLPSAFGRLCGSLLVASLVLAGCQTAAENELVASRAAFDAGSAQAEACFGAVAGKPEYAQIAQRTGLIAGIDPTLAQLSDNAVPSPEEARLLLAWDAEITSCRQIFLDALGRSFPELQMVQAESYAHRNQAILALVRREASWGAVNQRLAAGRLDHARRWRQAVEDIAMRLSAQHQQEIAQRERAAAAFAAAAGQMQQQMLLQQAIQNANRPVTTNCTRFGNMTNCQSF
jgi:hypothetical protein